MIYIEHLTIEDKFDLESFFTKIHQTVPYDPSWPLICIGAYYREDLYVNGVRDFIDGKKRTKPSNYLLGNFESVERTIASNLKMCGPVSATSASCTSGAYALMNAYGVSLAYDTPVIVASGSRLQQDGLWRYMFAQLGALSLDTGIPFDKNSKGFRPGESQTFFIVSAKPINPIARIPVLKFHTQVSQTTGTGSTEDIKNALFTGVDLDNICWWNAHSPGTPLGDMSEYQIFNDVIGSRDIPISSLKGKYGHSLGGSYLFEIGQGINSIRTSNVIPPNTGIVEPIVNDQRIITQEQKATTNSFLKFNMGFGGKNVLSIIDVVV